MGKDNRPWRKEVKKLQRKRRRQHIARINEETTIDDEDEEDPSYKIEEEKWLERERQAQEEFQKKRDAEERLRKAKEEDAERIRKQWDEKKKRDEEIRKEKERIEKEMREKQEAEFNTFLNFLCGDIEVPPLPYVMPDIVDDGRGICPFFARTSTCRFFDRCCKNHPRPTMSHTILIPNFFSHFSLEQGMRDEYDTDLTLEYEDSDMYKEFLDFYNDVLPEFRKYGTVRQFKVCCNFQSHLRGNVYVQYETIRDAVQAYRVFNFRFYNGKQLSLQFVKIDSWKSAICGLFCRKRCPKGRTCNFVHVFRNPTKEFVTADNDWSTPRVSIPTTPIIHLPSPSPRLASGKILYDSAATKSSSSSNLKASCSSNSVPKITNNTNDQGEDSSSEKKKHKEKKQHKHKKKSKKPSKKKKRKKSKEHE